jgi:DnaJ-class molecular chaperone
MSQAHFGSLSTRMAKDHYKVLGVEKTASAEEIQKAYRDLARKYHPDLNPDDKSAKKKFQEVQAAFDVLGDPAKRQRYDKFGPGFESMEGAAHAGGGGPVPPDFDFAELFGSRFGGGGFGGFGGGFGDFFKQAGGGARSRRGRAQRFRGADAEHSVEIPFAVAIDGGRVQIDVPRPTGKIDSITVKIPSGIEDGKKIRLRGQGHAADDGEPGDLFLTVHVAAHPYFTRRGSHLHVRVPITLLEAAAGAKIDVPSPHGTVVVRVPPASSSGTRLRVKGQGVRLRGKDPGDLFVELQIELPHQLDAASLEAIRQIDHKHPVSPRKGLRW